MGKALVDKLLSTLDKMEWPASPQLTELGRESYEIGLDKIDQYRGDTKTLAGALRIFQSGDSRPYALAGVAYTLIAAARRKDGSYYQPGLDAAMSWLEQAQEMAPDQVEINFVEGLIYAYSNRLDDTRTILDYLEQVAPGHFRLATVEIAYWEQQRNLDEMVYWYERALGNAESVPQKLRLRSQLGDHYLEFKMPGKALQVYEEAIHFDKENPLLWHNMSLAYWMQEAFEEAARCNRKSLELGKLPAAVQMKSRLDEKLDSGGFAKRLFRR
jgi:tetratricopeptide (TPR) repeat protein